jgi:DNA-binding XRE family transcriptional regulator
MSEEYEKEFCVLLKSLRVNRQEQRRWGMKWTQDAVAKKLGVSRVTYNNWENGNAVPSRIHLKKMLLIFTLTRKRR